MHIPSGYTYQQVHEIIETVVSRMYLKYTFPGYTSADIKQESYIICMDALPRFIVGTHPLENFLSTNLSNRLKNFVRDNYYTTTDNQERIRLMKSEQLDNDFTIIDKKLDGQETEDALDYKHMAKIVDKYIPVNMRMDYLKMLSDAYVPKNRREEITLTIREILMEHNYDVEAGQDI